MSEHVHEKIVNAARKSQRAAAPAPTVESIPIGVGPFGLPARAEFVVQLTREQAEAFKALPRKERRALARKYKKQQEQAARRGPSPIPAGVIAEANRQLAGKSIDLAERARAEALDPLAQYNNLTPAQLLAAGVRVSEPR